MISSFKQRQVKIKVLSITPGDLLVTGLLIVYACFYWGTSNNLDFTAPFIYFLFYVYARVYHAGNYNYRSALYTIIPVIILTHVLVCVLQLTRVIPAFHSYFLVGSTFGNPDALGAYLAVLMTFCYATPGRREIKYTILFFAIVLLVLLQARTALVATVVTGIIYLLLTGKISGKQFVTWLLAPFISGFILLIWWHPASVQGRLFTWVTSSMMIFKKPMGWGLYAFEKQYLEFQSEYIANHQIPEIFNPDLVHSSYNEFLNIGGTLGIIGLLVFILLVVFILKTAYEVRSPFFYPLCAFLLISIAYHPFKITPLVVIIILFIAIVLSSNQVKSVCKINLGHGALLLFPVLLLTTLLIGCNLQGYNTWKSAVENTRKVEWHMANAQFEDSYQAMKGNGRFLITWANLQYRMGNTARALSLLKEAEYYFCDDVFLKNMAGLYEETGQIMKAKQAYVKAVNMVPRAFGTPYEYILFLQRTGEHEEAYEEAVKLYNKPVRSTYYADPFIIKSKLEKIIHAYEEEQTKK